MSLPIRTRLTLAFTVGMAAVLAGLGAFVYARLGSDLMQGIDLNLRARAQVIAAAIHRQDPSVIKAGGNLIDPDEAFAQVLDPSATIVDTSPGVAAASMLTSSELATTPGSLPAFFTTRVRGVDDPVRLLAVRQPETALFVVVGATLGDRNEAMGRLLRRRR